MREHLISELRLLLAKNLRLGQAAHNIEPTHPLFGTELGLDSVDAAELILVLERHYGVCFSDRELARLAGATLESLAILIEEKEVDRPSGPDAG